MPEFRILGGHAAPVGVGVIDFFLRLAESVDLGQVGPVPSPDAVAEDQKCILSIPSLKGQSQKVSSHIFFPDGFDRRHAPEQPEPVQRAEKHQQKEHACVQKERLPGNAESGRIAKWPSA